MAIFVDGTVTTARLLYRPISWIPVYFSVTNGALWDRCIMGFVKLIYCCVGVGEHRSSLTRAYLGLVTPLGWPISIQEQRWMPFLGIRSQNGQMVLKVKGSNPHFQYKIKESQDAYLVILAQIYCKSSHRQARFPRIPCRNDLGGQGQLVPFSIPAKGIPWCMFGANLMIPAQSVTVCDELSCRQGP